MKRLEHSPTQSNPTATQPKEVTGVAECINHKRIFNFSCANQENLSLVISSGTRTRSQVNAAFLRVEIIDLKSKTRLDRVRYWDGFDILFDEKKGVAHSFKHLSRLILRKQDELSSNLKLQQNGKYVGPNAEDLIASIDKILDRCQLNSDSISQTESSAADPAEF